LAHRVKIVGEPQIALSLRTGIASLTDEQVEAAVFVVVAGDVGTEYACVGRVVIGNDLPDFGARGAQRFGRSHGCAPV